MQAYCKALMWLRFPGWLGSQNKDVEIAFWRAQCTVTHFLQSCSLTLRRQGEGKKPLQRSKACCKNAP